jgi:hypothetical protein
VAPVKTPPQVLARWNREIREQRVTAERALVIAKVLTRAEFTSERKAILRAAAVLIGDDRLEAKICEYPG